MLMKVLSKMQIVELDCSRNHLANQNKIITFNRGLFSTKQTQNWRIRRRSAWPNDDSKRY